MSVNEQALRDSLEQFIAADGVSSTRHETRASAEIAFTAAKAGEDAANVDRHSKLEALKALLAQAED